MTNITLHIPNISCGHCIHTVQNEVGDIAGVHSVKADLQTKSVTIAYDPPATQEQIEAMLAEIDYPAEKLLAL